VPWRMAMLVCAAIACARPVVAQQSVDYASVSGRVTDAQGAVVAGAQVSARQTDTNVTAETVTDSAGRFRFPYLKVGPYALKVRMRWKTAQNAVSHSAHTPHRCCMKKKEDRKGRR
jgi:protocatechuate 3,4-dioxygenase beta subunit